MQDRSVETSTSPSRPGPFPVITGPTAVGKTALSLSLARAIGGEIISCDSRQVYRDLDIGTAKPSAEEQSRVPHHFIDERSLGESFSAGTFAKEAHERIRAVQSRGAVPLVVGGSTLYLEALVHGIADIPDVPETVRKDTEQEMRSEGGPKRLFRHLQHIDPRAAATLDVTKTQRIIRFVSVYRATGQPISAFWDEQPVPPHRFHVIVLHRDRSRLYARIEKRVDRMMDEGLIAENEELLNRGISPSLPPLRTIGYREPMAFLRGEISLSEMTRLVKRNSRRYAKRQLTWLRRHDYTWLDAETATPDDVLSAVHTESASEGAK